MVHARKDYSRFQDPALADPSLLGEGSTPIAEDEPVMLFRAKDIHFIEVLRWYQRCLKLHSASEMVDAVECQIERAKAWRKTHGAKIPDMPPRSEKE